MQCGQRQRGRPNFGVAGLYVCLELDVSGHADPGSACKLKPYSKGYGRNPTEQFGGTVSCMKHSTLQVGFIEY